MVQSDIQNLLNNLTEQLGNVTNITLNFTGDLSKIPFDTWYLFFLRGTPPLLPSTEYACDLNDSFTLHKTITYNYTGGIAQGFFTKTEDVHCDYGCNPSSNSCELPLWTRYGIIAIFSVIILIIVYILFRRAR